MSPAGKEGDKPETPEKAEVKSPEVKPNKAVNNKKDEAVATPEEPPATPPKRGRRPKETIEQPEEAKTPSRGRKRKAEEEPATKTPSKKKGTSELETNVSLFFIVIQQR